MAAKEVWQGTSGRRYKEGCECVICVKRAREAALQTTTGTSVTGRFSMNQPTETPVEEKAGTRRVSITKPKPSGPELADVWKTASSSRPNVYHYTIRMHYSRLFTCTCEGYQFNEMCRHIKDIEGA